MSNLFRKFQTFATQMNEPIFILNIETSGEVCSVSLSVGKDIIHFKETKEGFNHAEALFLFIDEVFKESKTEIKQLAAVAISGGPGSYTGLRIGTSAAKGICYALNIPLISISTLQMIANDPLVKEKLNEKDVICANMDAGRMEIYYELFDSHLKPLEKSSNLIIDEKSFETQLNKNRFVFCGNANEKMKPFFEHKNVLFIDQIEPSSIKMASLSYQKWVQNDFENMAYFEPNYIKNFVPGIKKKI